MLLIPEVPAITGFMSYPRRIVEPMTCSNPTALVLGVLRWRDDSSSDRASEHPRWYRPTKHRRPGSRVLAKHEVKHKRSAPSGPLRPKSPLQAPASTVLAMRCAVRVTR